MYTYCKYQLLHQKIEQEMSEINEYYLTIPITGKKYQNILHSTRFQFQKMYALTHKKDFTSQKFKIYFI